MHNFVYLAQRRSQEFSCEPNFEGGGVLVPIDRQQQRRAAGLLPSALRAGDIDRQLQVRCGHRAAGAGAQQQLRAASR